MITKECHDFKSSLDFQKSRSVVGLMRKNVTSHKEEQSIVDLTNERKMAVFNDKALGSNSLLSLCNDQYCSPASTRKRAIELVSEFEMDCLKAHNEFRSKHGVQMLKLNEKLCKFAEEWAINLASRANPVHRSNSPYGENIFCSWSNSSYGLVVYGREPVEHWYGEVESHVFYKEPTTLKTGHFTQVVWRDSKELGVGQARSKTGQVVIVCNYDPPGNFIGSFTENVPPVGGFPLAHSQHISKANEFTNTSLSSSSHSNKFTDFATKMLRWHNYYRKKHGVPLLR